jgi:DNA repair exonuclease SbcCD ATPase subunit
MGDLSGELERLRAHLAETEETHTAELTLMQQHIDQLESELEQARQAVTDKPPVVVNTVDNHSEQELSRVRLENQLLASQLEELNALLAGYEQAKRTEYDLVTGRLKADLALVSQELASERQQLANERETCSHLQQQLEKLQYRQQQAQQQKQLLSLAETRTDIADLQSQQQHSQQPPGDLVDKAAVRALLLQYLAPHTQTAVTEQNEILALLSRVLDFSTEDRQLIGLHFDPATSRWQRRTHDDLRGRDRGGANPQASNTENNYSLADGWISFLLNESKPALDEEQGEEMKV